MYPNPKQHIFSNTRYIGIGEATTLSARVLPERGIAKHCFARVQDVGLCRKWHRQLCRLMRQVQTVSAVHRI